jgi:hypothetical protein
MADGAFLALVILFFLAAGRFVALCERVRGARS